MDERISFIDKHLSGDWTMTELCGAYGISRKTGYKWVERYRVGGRSGLSERSRAPRVHGLATPEHLAEAIVGLRRERPTWGPRKIIAKLSQREPGVEWPAVSTAGDILKRSGLVGAALSAWRAAPAGGADGAFARQSCGGGGSQGMGAAGGRLACGAVDDDRWVQPLPD
jgi:putative transposase